MDHQDHTIIILNGRKKPIEKRNAAPRVNVDLHKIKIENEQENFKIETIPKKICNQIATARNLKKLTQKEMAQRLGVQINIYTTLENGKAIYDGKTKQLVNKLQHILGTKFVK